MDPDYEQNEDKYKGIKAELLGENSDGDESGSNSDSDESDSEDEKGRVNHWSIYFCPATLNRPWKKQPKILNHINLIIFFTVIKLYKSIIKL